MFGSRVRRDRRRLLVVALVALVVTGGGLTARAYSASAAQTASVERLITMAAVEPKGGALVEREAFPSAPLPAGGGYLLKEPDATGRWEVSTYRWDPGTIVVHQGDEISLEILGVNGADHHLRIEGYQLHEHIQRGQISRLTFKATQAGIFAITCDEHLPAMRGQLVVLAAV